MMFNPQTVSLTTAGKTLKVHLFSTGVVAVKTKFRESNQTGLLAMINFIRDKKFTEWMPIWVLVIEHPEGIFVIDAGEIADVTKRGYFKSSGIIANWFDTTQFKFRVDHEEEIDQQLAKLHITIKDVKTVVLTHLHFDHTDGLKYFPETEIIVNKLEWEKPFGALPKLYPPWFKPTLIELNEQYDVFEHVQYLTEAKDILLIHTPGHTYGHCSVLLKTDVYNILFAADVCYSQEQILFNKYAGNNASMQMAKDTYDKIRAFAKKHKLVFLPSHDGKASLRLKKLILLEV